jgi:hypothetical protein
MPKMKPCKTCSKEVAASAKTCPNCGAKLKMGGFKKLLIWLSIFIVMIIVIAVASSGGGTQTSGGSNSPKISKAEFDQLKTGMTYKEAVDIIGGEGTVTAETGEEGTDLHTVAYSFEGSGSLGANAQLMFQGDKLDTKAQFGLK